MSVKKKIEPLASSILCFLIFAFLYTGAKVIFARNENPVDYTGPSQNLFNLHIPKDLHFAGEPIPQDDYSIKENMEKVFNSGSFERSTAFVLFSRASSWFPMIERILKKNNIPDDFKYIALAESRLTNSTSPQGAVGFWQFVPTTGSHYGLEINSDVDERYNVEKSTEAACRFFREAYRRFGNWTLVAAAYNLGMGGIEHHLKKQPSKSYNDLMMNKETSGYMYRILALKKVFTNSGKKFFGGKNIYNIPTSTFKTDSSIVDLSVFAKSKGYSLEILKTFNPWLISGSLSNPGRRTYIIRFPAKDYLKKMQIEMPADTVAAKTDTAAVQIPAADTLVAKPDTTKGN